MPFGKSKNAPPPIIFTKPSAAIAKRHKRSRDLAVRLAKSIVQGHEYEIEAAMKQLNTLTEWDINGCFTITIPKPPKYHMTGFGVCREYDLDPPEMPKRQTLLGLAVRYGSLETCRRLLEHPNASPNAQAERDGNTPLHIAVILGRTEIVDYLATHPAIDLSMKNRDGQTPLDIAFTASLGQPEDSSHAAITKILMELSSTVDTVRVHIGPFGSY